MCERHWNAHKAEQSKSEGAAPVEAGRDLLALLCRCTLGRQGRKRQGAGMQRRACFILAFMLVRHESHHPLPLHLCEHRTGRCLCRCGPPRSSARLRRPPSCPSPSCRSVAVACASTRPSLVPPHCLIQPHTRPHSRIHLLCPQWKALDEIDAGACDG